YELIRLGIPITLMLSFESAIFYAAMIAMGSFGADQLAAHSVAMQIVSSAFKVPFGLGQAATIQIAQAVAQNDINQARRAGWTAYLCALVFAGSTAALMLFWPTALIGFFLALDDPANAQAIRIAKSFLVLAGRFQLVDAAQAVSSGVLRGFKDAVVPMMLAGIG